MHEWLSRWVVYVCPVIFFFNDTATTEIYTLSLHDALPISRAAAGPGRAAAASTEGRARASVDDGDLDRRYAREVADRKSTRLNSSHANISYAVFCLKKKNPDSVSALCGALLVRCQPAVYLQ